MNKKKSFAVSSQAPNFCQNQKTICIMTNHFKAFWGLLVKVLSTQLRQRARSRVRSFCVFFFHWQNTHFTYIARIVMGFLIYKLLETTKISDIFRLFTTPTIHCTGKERASNLAERELTESDTFIPSGNKRLSDSSNEEASSPKRRKSSTSEEDREFSPERAPSLGVENETELRNTTDEMTRSLPVTGLPLSSWDLAQKQISSRTTESIDVARPQPAIQATSPAESAEQVSHAQLATTTSSVERVLDTVGETAGIGLTIKVAKEVGSVISTTAKPIYGAVASRGLGVAAGVAVLLTNKTLLETTKSEVASAIDRINSPLDIEKSKPASPRESFDGVFAEDDFHLVQEPINAQISPHMAYEGGFASGVVERESDAPTATTQGDTTMGEPAHELGNEITESGLDLIPSAAEGFSLTLDFQFALTDCVLFVSFCISLFLLTSTIFFECESSIRRLISQIRAFSFILSQTLLVLSRFFSFVSTRVVRLRILSLLILIFCLISLKNFPFSSHLFITIDSTIFTAAIFALYLIPFDSRLWLQKRLTLLSEKSPAWRESAQKLIHGPFLSTKGFYTRLFCSCLLLSQLSLIYIQLVQS